MADEDKKKLFAANTSNNNGRSGSYPSALNQAKQALNGFTTYDFASTDLILKSFENAFDEDRKVKLKSNTYGDHFDRLKQELSEFLEGKEISVNDTLDRVSFKFSGSDTELGPEDLSHGELKKLSLYLWLKHITQSGAIILMDEVDIALHPKWQYQIVEDIAKWAQNSQFILATHSPQILSSTHYKNLIKLKQNGDKTEIVRYHQPPVDRDINAIISTIMDAPHFPAKVKELQKQYRKMVDSGEVDSDKAKALKQILLQYISENSAFFQQIYFDLELM